ncbi:hypothetical protein EVA_02815 [gut metagenome]|uniref:Uncharacterized protein n=1 Tax=gut metagenome TaxID=749906 RepID=J9GNA1_9ZZZZ
MDTVFLTPFQQLALEIHFLIGYDVNIQELAHNPLFDEPFAVGISAVEIGSTYQGFKSITSDMITCLAGLQRRVNELCQPKFFCQFVEGSALHNLAAGTGQETFVFPVVTMVDNVTNNCLQNGISQELKAFII